MTTNELGYAKYLEDKRSNLAVEAETNRANLAREAETHRANVTAENEILRNHLAVETETNRSNVARESENYRHNFAVESETNRANLATESWRNASLNETIRSNRAQEALSSQRNAIASQANSIQAQHNRTMQSLTANKQLLDYSVATRNLDITQQSTTSNVSLNKSRENLAKAQADTETWKQSNYQSQNMRNSAEAQYARVKASTTDALLNSQIYGNYVGATASVIGSIGTAARGLSMFID